MYILGYFPIKHTHLVTDKLTSVILLNCYYIALGNSSLEIADAIYIGALGIVMFNKVDYPIFTCEFESHWVPHSYHLVPYLSKNLSKLQHAVYTSRSSANMAYHFLCFLLPFKNFIYKKNGPLLVGTRTS